MPKVRQTTTCHTCRTRKLGCDGRKPSCSQCLFSSRTCAGYSHDLIFISHSTPRSKKDPVKRAVVHARQGRSSITKHGLGPTTKPVVTYAGVLSANKSNSAIRDDIIVNVDPSTSLDIPTNIPLIDDDSESHAAQLILKYAPWIEDCTQSLVSNQKSVPVCGSWVDVLSHLLLRVTHHTKAVSSISTTSDADAEDGWDDEGTGEELQLAIKTLGLTIGRHVNGKDQVVEQGDRTEGSRMDEEISLAYQEALKSLRSGMPKCRLTRAKLDEDGASIERVDGAERADIVAACLCLCLAELMQPTSKQGWKVHLRGIGKMMQLAGPTQYAVGECYQLFLGLRPLLLFEAIQSRRPSFLANEKWQTIPFTHNQPHPFHLLLNHGAQIPALLEKFDLFMESSPLQSSSISVATAYSLWMAFNEVISNLADWEFSSYSAKSQFLWPRFASGDVSDEIKMEQQLWFSDAAAANAFTHLWAFMIICLRHQFLLRIAFPMLNFQSDIEKAEIICVFGLAARIINSMTYLLQDEMRLKGQMEALLPFTMAQNVFFVGEELEFEGTPAVVERLRVYCKEIAEEFRRKGFDLSLF